METWTAAEKVRSRWIAEEPPEDDDLLNTKIGQVERLIRRHFPDMQARLEATGADGGPAEPDLAETIADVVADLLQEHFANPLGVRSMQDTEGPWTLQQTMAGDAPGKLVLSAEHKKMLAPPMTSRSRLRTINTEQGSYLAAAAMTASETPDGWPT
ncbi:hypothetical protein [Nesterenkonia sp. K-15-9-6]|uniref:hypothetical protein n=1 Tax=Nesterenkonia sp. K-15-9-6 TaxID=3093918 RepID=UPI004044E96A